MDGLPNAKELKKLAEACRKAGICSFKGYGVEFTLSEQIPAKRSRNRGMRPAASAQPSQEDTSPFASDTLSEEELLFFSVGTGVPIDDPTGVS